MLVHAGASKVKILKVALQHAATAIVEKASRSGSLPVKRKLAIYEWWVESNNLYSYLKLTMG